MPLPAIEFCPGTPKVQQIAEAWARVIEAGELPAGSRLPPVRELTAQLGVSKFTVIEALDRLRARNLITSSQGRGHFVANRHAPKLPGADTDWLPQDLASVLRRSLLADSSSLRPGSGHLPAGWLEDASLRQALRTVARSTRLRIAGYGAPAGYLPLRQSLQARLHSQGITAPLEQIVTTSNTVQALDMLLRLLLRPGDCVVLDSPCYFNFHANLALHGARIVTLQRGADGLDLQLSFWINDPQNGRGGVTSDVNRAIWRALKENHVEVPFPQREMRILGPVPEAMTPPESTSVPKT